MPAESAPGYSLFFIQGQLAHAQKTDIRFVDRLLKGIYALAHGAYPFRVVSGQILLHARVLDQVVQQRAMAVLTNAQNTVEKGWIATGGELSF